MAFYSVYFVYIQDLAADGPVPWASQNNVTFIAEQVSHHPPSKQLYLLWIIQE